MTRATPEPVAPTPSPDIAGLVAELLGGSNSDALFIRRIRNEAVTALQSVAQERDAAKKRLDDHSEYSIDLQRIIEALCKGRAPAEPQTTARFHYDMAVEYRAAAEARIATARDEGLEMAAKVADELRAEREQREEAYIVAEANEAAKRANGGASAARSIAAAIRALKGQPK